MPTLSLIVPKTETRFKFFRSLQGKLILWFFIILLLPVLTIGGLIYYQLSPTLTAEVITKLIAVRDFKADQINEYFRKCLTDTQIFIQMPVSLAALNSFEQAIESKLKALKMDETTIMNHYRSLYLGKAELNDAGDGSSYSTVHAQYHPLFKAYIAAYGYSDLLLVEPTTGNIIYSVNKTDNFATSLLQGQYANSPLNKVFRQVLLASKPDSIVLEDFSYDEVSQVTTALIATPLFENSKLKGVVIFQIPITPINAIMQKHSNLGNNYATILVSAHDFLIHSHSRLTNNHVGFKQKIYYEVSRAAANGESGITTIIDDNGNNQLVAYTPLTIAGVKWLLLVKMDKTATVTVIQTLLPWLFISLGITIGIGLIIAAFVSYAIVKPIRIMTETMCRLANGDTKLTVTINQSPDEIGVMAQAGQQLITYLQQLIEDIVQIAQGLVVGNLQVTPRIKYRGDFIAIKNQLEIALPQLRQIIGDIVQVSQGLAQGNLQVIPQAEYQGDLAPIKPAVVTILTQLQQIVTDIVAVSQGLAEGRQQVMPSGQYRGEFAQIKTALTNAATQLTQIMIANANQDWLKTGITQLNDQMRGDLEITPLAKNIITFLCTYLDAKVGLFYVKVEFDNKPILKSIASYAYTHRKRIANEFQLGEGLVGQAALEQQPIIVTQVPKEYIQIQSGSGESAPHNLIVMPFQYEDKLKGVIELGTLEILTAAQLEFLNQAMPNIGIAIHTAQSRSQMQALLQQSTYQTTELLPSTKPDILI